MSLSYQNPLAERYSSSRMTEIFSSQIRYKTWRELWIALAEAERELGISITKKQILELKKYVNDIDFNEVSKIEREVRHDVMAHILAYGKKAKSAAPIIHLGATSCFVTDNADLLIYRDALRLVSDRLIDAIRTLSKFVRKEAARPALGYTHLQPAQLTTVGKRAALWLQDLQLDYEHLTFVLNHLKFRSIKGATGSQASFTELFKGDHKKVKQLEQKITKMFGFKSFYAVGGQTYPRKVDAEILAALTGIALSVSKMTNDIRYLQSVRELEEPFAKKQIGSSAMAYKRNPMRCERADSLARLVLSLATSPQMTAAAQFLERTLDDSANRRIAIPEAFLATDAILLIIENIADGLTVYPEIIAQRVNENLPFIATEAILMLAVSRGKSRQDVHERIRTHAMTATQKIRKGQKNNLVDLMAEDPEIGLSLEEIQNELDPTRCVGRAPEQTKEYLSNEVVPLLRRYRRYFPADKVIVKY